ncbi:MAG: quinoprotein dehydrogenase-associated putative ABC transporter substrate-binding protein [Candidatus Methylomirabilales bacterium]
MSRKSLRLAALFFILIPSVFIGDARGDDVKVLRVCADPNNLPFSNKQQEGFENRIAELTAKELGAKLSYYWWPHQRGLVRNTLRAGRCDVIIGVPKEYERVLATTPYYRTGYVLAYAKDRGLKISSLDDPVLKKLRIGVYRNTPPQQALAERGIFGDNLVQYSRNYDWEHPEDFLLIPVKDLIAGKIDVVMIWGPDVGYCVKKISGCNLQLVQIKEDNPHWPMSFEFSMGVKHGNKELRAQLNQVLEVRQAEIMQVLKEYGVPIFDRVAQKTN